MQQLYRYLAKWSKTTDNLAKMQGVYGALALVLIVLAGIISLINASLGQAVAFYAIIAGLTFIGNGVVWALTRTFVVPHIERNAPTSARSS